MLIKYNYSLLVHVSVSPFSNIEWYNFCINVLVNVEITIKQDLGSIFQCWFMLTNAVC